MNEARGTFDLRLNITAATEQEVYELALQVQATAQETAPAGVEVRYVVLRPPSRSPSFPANMKPQKKAHA